MLPRHELSVDDVYSEIFAALSEPVRIRIIRMIAETDELACTRLDETLPISKSTISYHIKVLHHAGLISVRKDGRYYHYRLKAEVLQRYLPGFTEQLVSAGGAESTTRARVRATRAPAAAPRKAPVAASARPLHHG
jgi:DNA-binding transcriptional ArsR family regulator